VSEGQQRSARITRRTFGAMGLALAALAGVKLLPEDALGGLAKREDAAALKALGRLPAAQAEGDVETRLRAKLADRDYDAARAADGLSGAFIVMDGWHVPEVTVLAAAWLAQQS
jgi:hypothetical protein